LPATRTVTVDALSPDAVTPEDTSLGSARKMPPQCGHFPRFPAYLSGTENRCSHSGQTTAMDMFDPSLKKMRWLDHNSHRAETQIVRRPMRKPILTPRAFGADWAGYFIAHSS
jgi:hypothetical protein